MEQSEIRNWKLSNTSSSETYFSEKVIWIEWDLSGNFKKRSKTPKTGRSLMLSPFTTYSYAALTEPVTILHEVRDDYIKFDTDASSYELFKLIK